MKAATRQRQDYQNNQNISIHAAREGGDAVEPEELVARVISIHAAREGGDERMYGVEDRAKAFQSTPPVKAATLSWNMVVASHQNFNPRRP